MEYFEYIDWISLVSVDGAGKGWPKSAHIRRGRTAAYVPLSAELARLGADVTGVPLPPSSPRMPNEAMAGFKIVDAMLGGNLPANRKLGVLDIDEIGVAINHLGLLAISIKVAMPKGSRNRSEAQDKVDNAAMIIAHMVKRMIGVDVRSRDEDVPEEDASKDDARRYRLGPGNLRPVPIDYDSAAGTARGVTGVQQRATAMLQLDRLGAFTERGGTESNGARTNAMSILTQRSIDLRDRLIAAIDMHRGSFRFARPFQSLSAELGMTIAALSGVFLGIVFSETLVREFDNAAWIENLLMLLDPGLLVVLVGLYLLYCGARKVMASSAQEGSATPFRPAADETDRPFRILSLKLISVITVLAGVAFLHHKGLPSVGMASRLMEQLGVGEEVSLALLVALVLVALVLVALLLGFLLRLGTVILGIVVCGVVVGTMYAAFLWSEFSVAQIIAAKPIGKTAEQTNSIALSHIVQTVIMITVTFAALWAVAHALWTISLGPLRWLVAGVQGASGRTGTFSWLLVIPCVWFVLGAGVPRMVADHLTFSNLEKIQVNRPDCSHKNILNAAQGRHDPLYPKNPDAQDFWDVCDPERRLALPVKPFEAHAFDHPPSAMDKTEAGILALVLIFLSVVIYFFCWQFQSRSEEVQRIAAQWADDGVDSARAEKDLRAARLRLRMVLSFVPVTLLVLGCVLYALPMSLPGDASASGDLVTNSVVYRDILTDIGWALPVLAFGILAQVWNTFGVSGATTLIHEVTLARLASLQTLIKADKDFIERLGKNVAQPAAQNNQAQNGASPPPTNVLPAGLYLPNLEREATLLDPKIDLIEKLKDIVSNSFVRRSALVGAVVLAALQIQPLKSLQPDEPKPAPSHQELVAARFLKCIEDSGDNVQECFAGSGGGGGAVEVTINGVEVPKTNNADGKQVYSLAVGLVPQPDASVANKLDDLGTITVEGPTRVIPSIVKIIDKNAPDGQSLDAPQPISVPDQTLAHNVDVTVDAHPSKVIVVTPTGEHVVDAASDEGTTVQVAVNVPEIRLGTTSDDKNAIGRIVEVEKNVARIDVAPAKVRIVGDVTKEPHAEGAPSQGLDEDAGTTIVLQPNRVVFAAGVEPDGTPPDPASDVSVRVEKFGDGVIARVPEPNVVVRLETLHVPADDLARDAPVVHGAVVTESTDRVVRVPLEQDPVRLEVTGAGFVPYRPVTQAVATTPGRPVEFHMAPPRVATPSVSLQFQQRAPAGDVINLPVTELVKPGGLVRVDLQHADVPKPILEIRGPDGQLTPVETVQDETGPVARVTVDAHAPELVLIDRRSSTHPDQPPGEQKAGLGDGGLLLASNDKIMRDDPTSQAISRDKPFTIEVPVVELTLQGKSIPMQIDRFKRNPAQIFFDVYQSGKDVVPNPAGNAIPTECANGKFGEVYFYKGFESDGGMLCYAATQPGSSQNVTFKRPGDTANRERLSREILPDEYPGACDPNGTSREVSVGQQLQEAVKEGVASSLSPLTGQGGMQRDHHLLLIGFTDSTGRLQNNTRIATDRANAVKNLLKGEFPEITAIGRGEEVLMPVRSQDTAPSLDAPDSRRVDLYLCEVDKPLAVNSDGNSPPLDNSRAGLPLD